MNKILLKGKIVEQELYKTFETHGETFVELKLEVRRKSDVADVLPITMSLNQFNSTGGNKFLEIIGEIRTRNFIENEKSRLIITVFAKEVRSLGCEEYENSVELIGFLCKQPIIRGTPVSLKSICDVLIAVNGRNNRTSYIPSIAWNKDGVWLAEQPVGTEISVSGRLQSRNYQKNIDGQIEECTAIELCIKNLIKIEKGE